MHLKSKYFSNISGLLKHYNPSHPDYHSTNMALVKMQSIIGKMSVRLRETVRNEESIMIYYIRFTICRPKIERKFYNNWNTKNLAINNDVKKSRNKRKSKTAIIEQLYSFLSTSAIPFCHFSYLQTKHGKKFTIYFCHKISHFYCILFLYRKL